MFTPSRALRAVAVATFAVLAVCGSLAQVNAAAGDFTLVLFPDTQNEAQYYPQVLNNQVQWVVNNRTGWNIQAVLGLGDIVNDGASTAQQQNADAAIKLLDNAKIPYLLSIGNHDYDGANTGASTRTATGFNQWWGPQRYAGYSWYKGNLNGSNENFWGELAINGKNYLFMILEYVPRTTSLNWAASVVQAHPSDEVIVVTHSFMFYDNTRVDKCDTNDLNRDNPGDKNWANFASKYPNISMVVSGHITTGLAARRADLGVNGNLVNQMLSNYQVLANGGDGWIRLLTFHPSSNTVDVKTYSPYLNSYKTDSKNQFTIFWHNPNVTTGSSTLTGRVTSTSCAKLAGATVSAGGISSTTDTAGRYSLTVPPGTYNLSVNASGYASQTQSVKAWDGYGPDVNFYLTTGSGSGGTGVALSPTSLTFASQAVGTTSSAQTITLKNGSTSSVSITGAGVSGDFAISSFACPTTLPAGASCSTNIVFKPTANGTRTGTFTIGVSTGNQTASLTGTGGTSTTGSVTLSPASLTFPSTNVGSTSAGQNVTLNNGTTAAVSITTVAASGDFAVSSNSCGTSLAAGGSCAIGVVFKPSASGTRTGTLSVSDSSGTQTASLTGTGATSTSGGGTGGSCTASGPSPSVTICTPAANSNVTSPVLVTAAAADSNPIKALQIYLDGVKVYEVAANSLSTNVTMSSGVQHRLTVQAIDSTSLVFKQTIYVTAK